MDTTKDAVRDRYRRKAVELAGDAGSESGCCAGSFEDDISSWVNYKEEELLEIGLNSSISLGCGNPLLLADLRPGEVVLDLGSGGGLDVLLSARRVLPGGHAYGLDMTDEMLELANRNREQAGIINATFLKGTIEQIPLPDNTVDVVISNCVINLSEDKGAVLREAFRVLKPAGRLAVSDMVEIRPLPEEVKQDLEARIGCLAGTISVQAYHQLLLEAGFEAADIEIMNEQEVAGTPGAVGSASIRARKPIPDVNKPSR